MNIIHSKLSKDVLITPTKKILATADGKRLKCFGEIDIDVEFMGKVRAEKSVYLRRSVQIVF